MDQWKKASVRYQNSLGYADRLKDAIRKHVELEKLHDTRIIALAKNEPIKSVVGKMARRYIEIVGSDQRDDFRGRPLLTYWQRCQRIATRSLQALGHSPGRITGSTYFQCEKCEAMFRLYENDIVGGDEFWLWIDDNPMWQIPDYDDLRENRGLPLWVVRDAERDLYACGEEGSG